MAKSKLIQANEKTAKGISIGIGDDRETYDAIIPGEQISAQMLAVLAYPEEQQSYELPAEILAIDEKNYAELCKKAGVPHGSVILLNHYSYNDNGNEGGIVPFLPEGKITLQLVKADGSVWEVEVQGVLTVEEMPKEFFYPNTNEVRLIVPPGRSTAWLYMVLCPFGYGKYFMFRKSTPDWTSGCGLNHLFY